MSSYFLRRGTARVAVAALVVTGLLVLRGAAMPTLPATTATAISTPQITAIASSPGSRTLAIRGGKVEWLSLNPTRWTPVSVPTAMVPALAHGPMRPTAVAVTNQGVGLAGMSDGVVVVIEPGARSSVNTYFVGLSGPVLALAGMGDLRHLQILVGTADGTYTLGAGSLTIWWPHVVASAVVAPANSQGAWAAIVNGRLMWRCAATSFTPTACKAPRWALASPAYLGRGALLTEGPEGPVAVATRSGSLWTGWPGSGLKKQLHAIAARPTGLVATFADPGSMLVMAAAGEPVLVESWQGWESLGQPASVRQLALVGASVVEVGTGGALKIVAIPSALAFPPPTPTVAGWLDPLLGAAVLLILLVLAGFATWRLPWRPRIAVFAVVGVVLVGGGGVAMGRVVMAPPGTYTRKQIQQAWYNGTGAGSSGSWLVTPSQCSMIAAASGWHGPLPTMLTTSVAADGPAQAVPTCDLMARLNVAQYVAASASPLDRAKSQDVTSYFVYLNLGSSAPPAAQAASEAACLRLPGCQSTGQNGHLPAYYAVRLSFPPKAYGLWQKVMGGAS